MSFTIQYIAHSAFYVKTGDYGILIDPFISQNPLADFDVSSKRITDILLTHAHADHLGDAIPISINKKAKISAVFELANYCEERGAQVDGVNLGGKIVFPWGSARFLPAFHSSSTPDGAYAGMPAAILLEIDGKRIYHAGDTCLNQEMKTVGDIYKPDYALLPIGSHFTMDIDEAVIAADWLGAKKVIPMHYNTFNLIETDVNLFKEKIEKAGKECVILKPSESIIL